MKKAVILVSGGVDSATVLSMVQKMGYDIYALSFNYQQRNKVEIQKVKELIKDYNVKQHQLIDINLSVFNSSALTSSDVSVPKYQSASDLKDDVPVTYVPARNTIFLSYAFGFAENIDAYDIFLGVNAIDYANYPDCRPEYLERFENMVNIATKKVGQGIKFTIHAPLINMTKTQIVKAGLELGVDYSKTISCYDPNILGESCGKCHSCLIRVKAFAENNMADLIKYVKYDY
jgi:7-cyano-7-deazaguanine synthase